MSIPCTIDADFVLFKGLKSKAFKLYRAAFKVIAAGGIFAPNDDELAEINYINNFLPEWVVVSSTMKFVASLHEAKKYFSDKK